MLEFEIPYPPSVNHYWGQRGKQRFLTKRAKEFRALIDDAVWNGFASTKAITGELAFFMTVWPPDKRKRDLDNLLKGTLDALMHAKVFEDDSQIWALSICWDRDNGKINTYPGGKARIRIVSA